VAISRKAGILILEKQSEQQELKDIIATREDGFGHLFKIARDEKNMSIDDVARELHLDKKIIIALESEDHTKLPVAAFVCGYIRNYAKLLNIQPEPLIEYYKNDRSDETLEPELKILKEKESSGQSIVSTSLSAIIVPVVTVLIFLALLAGGWQVWLYVSNNFLNNSSEVRELDTAGIENKASFNEQQEDKDALLLPELNGSYESSAEELVEESSLAVEDTIPAEDSSLVEESSPAEGSTPNNGSSSVEGAPSSPVGGASVDVPLSLPAVNDSESIEGVEVTQAPQRVNELPIVETSVQVEVDTQPVRFVKNQLILEFSGNSWISIKDANNKILATGLKKSPQILQLDGKTPYKVFLGDARVVKVSINGKIFDHSKYINEKNVARFNVK